MTGTQGTTAGSGGEIPVPSKPESIAPEIPPPSVEEPGAIAVGWQTMEALSRLEMPATRPSEAIEASEASTLPIKAS